MYHRTPPQPFLALTFGVNERLSNLEHGDLIPLQRIIRHGSKDGVDGIDFIFGYRQTESGIIEDVVEGVVVPIGDEDRYTAGVDGLERARRPRRRGQPLSPTRKVAKCAHHAGIPLGRRQNLA